MTFFAIDLGATSGRTFVVTLRENGIEQKEITRFPNKIIQCNGHFYWDIYALYDEVIKGLKKIAELKIEIDSIGVDTWGVDFVCIGEDGQILGTPLSYRDPYTQKVMEDYLCEHSRKKVYDKTGIQFMNFNSLFQLAAMRKTNSAILKAADKILFMPDALIYLLTGEKVCEYTIASTSQLLDAKKKDFDEELLNSVGVKRSQFGELVMPGTKVGELTKEIQRQTGLKPIPVVAVAGHDTASAVASIPAKDEKFAYLSSGTWSLMGIETKEAILNEDSYNANFTNEGGVNGTIRFLKNICGMWLLERCRAEWGKDCNYGELIAEAQTVAPFKSLINPDSVGFANPVSMVEQIKSYCKATSQDVPETKGEITRCIFESLALRYRQIMSQLHKFAEFPIEQLHIIGGGSQNMLLNQFTSNATQLPVSAGPVEGTLIGNIMMQAKAMGKVDSISEMRTLIQQSIKVDEYQPQESELWEKGYEKYLAVYREDI